jgi:hypothetical protein
MSRTPYPKEASNKLEAAYDSDCIYTLYGSSSPPYVPHPKSRRTRLHLNPTRHQMDPKRIYFRGKILGKTIPSYLKFCKENLATSKSIHYAAKTERLCARICGERRPPTPGQNRVSPKPPKGMRTCAVATQGSQASSPTETRAQKH